MREIRVSWIPEEDVGFWEQMREIWVFQILKGVQASILLPLARMFADTVPVADVFFETSSRVCLKSTIAPNDEPG